MAPLPHMRYRFVDDRLTRVRPASATIRTCSLLFPMPEVGSARLSPAKILVVDDELSARRLLTLSLEHLGHQVHTVGAVPEALDHLAREVYDLVLTDLRMPGPSGLELLRVVRTQHPGTRTVLMSGNAEIADAASAIDAGVDFLLLKPFTLTDLRLKVDQALARRRAEQAAAVDRETLEARVRQREAESQVWLLRSAHALAAAVEAKDEYTAGHATRVTAYALVIAEEVGGIDPVRFRLAGDLHDVGKIGVPDAVLNKPDRLTGDEFALVRRHPEIGARILEHLVDDPLVLGVVRGHHERWDGTGYPDRLRGVSTPLPARVLAIADTLDAMTSSRAYRTGLPWTDAVAEIRRCSGTQFDPAMVDVFDRVLPALEACYGSFVGSAADPD